MIIRHRRKEYYTPPEKKKASSLNIAVYIAVGAVALVLGYFAAHPLMILLGLV